MKWNAVIRKTRGRVKERRQSFFSNKAPDITHLEVISIEGIAAGRCDDEIANSMLNCPCSRKSNPPRDMLAYRNVCSYPSAQPPAKEREKEIPETFRPSETTRVAPDTLSMVACHEVTGATAAVRFKKQQAVGAN
jgi:hypothetical protein